MTFATVPPTEDGRGWRRAAALFAVVWPLSIVQPTLLVAVPLLLFFVIRPLRGLAVFGVVVVAMSVLLIGTQDGLWLMERAWALVVGGLFVALTVAMPGWPLSSRTLVAVGAGAATWAGMLAARAGAWAALDWSVSDHLRRLFARVVDTMVVLRGGEAVPPALLESIHDTAEARVALFPAMVALETMAALAVAWWLYVRLASGSDGAIGPLRAFRFNDHLIWLMIAGAGLLLAGPGEGPTRLGANVAVFMAALYALRGAGVVMFVTGGLSFFGASMLTIAVLFAAPLVIGLAVFTGIADTWLDLRGRVGSAAA